MKTDDRFLAVHNVSLLQRQAGVDPEVADLVIAYARILTDAGKPLIFQFHGFPNGSHEQKIFGDLLSKNPDQDWRFLGFLAAYGATFERRGLVAIYSEDHLCQLLGISKKHLVWICANPGKNYHEFRIPKKSGGDRIIFAPRRKLRYFQKWILRRILNHCEPHPHAHAFVRGHSIVTNARRHTDRKVIVRLDIKDFFPTITHASVRNVFQRAGYTYRVAATLANLCTLNGRLPQGALTSPALSNLVCTKMDRRFVNMMKKMDFRYTRYADDLIFSSDNYRLPSLIPFFREILAEEGFQLNEKKTKIMRSSRPQVVTGIVVNRRPNLAREHVRRLRAAVHRLRTQGPGALEIPSRRTTRRDPLGVLNGHLGLLQMINPAKAEKLKDMLG
jgi:retron-type reverse transcriptase